jgi:hypothetical protein
VDLLYLDLRLFLSAVDTALDKMETSRPPASSTESADSSRA